MNRVVVTGMGLVTPVGNDVRTTWANLAAGVGAGGPIAAFDASRHDTRIAAEVSGFELPFADRKALRRMDRFVQFALKAAAEAVADSGIAFTDAEKEATGVIIGAGIGGLRVIEEQQKNLLEGGPGRISPLLIPMLIPDMAAGQVAIHFGFKGVNFCTVSACASGAHALGTALQIMRAGSCDVMVAGGTEACITPLGLAGFCSMRALTTRNDDPRRASRPFERNRDGFLMGEGAGIVVLETLERARRRGAKIYAEIIGAGMSCDAHHMTAPDPEGAGAALCIRRALEDARISPADVGYINAHGTSTELNDRSETLAISRVFGERARSIPVSSVKSMIGHLLGAAGAVEAIACVKTIETGIIHPTINLVDQDPECDLDYVPNEARQTRVDVAMSNSFGFGGHDSCLIFKRI